MNLEDPINASSIGTVHAVRRTSEWHARTCLDELYTSRESVQFVKASEDDYSPDPYHVFGNGNSEDDFYEERFRAAFKAEHKGVKFYLRFGLIHEDPAESDPLPFGGLIVRLQDLPCKPSWHYLGFSSDFSQIYHRWRRFFVEKYCVDI